MFDVKFCSIRLTLIFSLLLSVPLFSMSENVAAQPEKSKGGILQAACETVSEVASETGSVLFGLCGGRYLYQRYWSSGILQKYRELVKQKKWEHVEKLLRRDSGRIVKENSQLFFEALGERQPLSALKELVEAYGSLTGTEGAGPDGKKAVPAFEYCSPDGRSVLDVALETKDKEVIAYVKDVGFRYGLSWGEEDVEGRRKARIEFNKELKNVFYCFTGIFMVPFIVARCLGF
ncbi:MAG: hypothetical protein JW725_01935 [Candidatus Babeliaceae bacterium]|nr:hypothetical protein [Candidatus Babeliaceae bacterium]